MQYLLTSIYLPCRDVVGMGNKVSDEIIWDTLDKVELKAKISSLPNGLGRLPNEHDYYYRLYKQA